MNDLFEQWAEEESSLGEVYELGEGVAAEVVHNLNRETMLNLIFGSFIDHKCFWCGEPMTEEDLHNSKTTTRQCGIEGLVYPVHGACYDNYEVPEIERLKEALTAQGIPNAAIRGHKVFDQYDICVEVIRCYYTAEGQKFLLCHDTAEAIRMIENGTGIPAE